MTQINLGIKEIYTILCKDCQDKVVKLVGAKLTEEQIREALEKGVQPPKAAS